MEYQLEYAPNPDVLIIRLKQRLIRGTILHYMGNYESTEKEFQEDSMIGKNLLTFCKTIAELDGMEGETFVNRYGLHVEKASMFSWEDLLPHILDALRTFIAKDGVLEEIGPAKRPTKEFLEALRKEGCDV